MRFQKPMFLKAIRLGKNNSDQQVSEECMFHFPLLVILGNFCEMCIKARCEKRHVTDLQTCPETRANSMRAWLFKFTQYIYTSLKMYNLVPLVHFFLLKIVLISYKIELNVCEYYHMAITVCNVKFKKRTPYPLLNKNSWISEFVFMPIWADFNFDQSWQTQRWLWLYVWLYVHRSPTVSPKYSPL